MDVTAIRFPDTVSIGTKPYYILKLKHPRCQIGNVLTNSRFGEFLSLLKMPNICPLCEQDSRFESGFYTAAFRINYPMALIIFVSLIILGFLLESIYDFFKISNPFAIFNENNDSLYDKVAIYSKRLNPVFKIINQ